MTKFTLTPKFKCPVAEWWKYFAHSQVGQWKTSCKAKLSVSFVVLLCLFELHCDRCGQAHVAGCEIGSTEILGKHGSQASSQLTL